MNAWKSPQRSKPNHRERKMKKYAVLTVTVLVLLVLMLTVAGSQEEMEYVDNSDFADPQRPAAVFR